MATMTLPEKSQMIVTLESGAVVSDIRKALKLIRGIRDAVHEPFLTRRQQHRRQRPEQSFSVHHFNRI